MNTKIETYSGRFFDYLNQSQFDMDPPSIAHALGNICRYTGHSRFFYSVAAHSLLCEEIAHMRELSLRVRLLCLVHDAHEAYVGDVNTPLKLAMNGAFFAIESNAEAVAHSVLSVPLPSLADRHTVKCVDLIALATEAYCLMPSRGIGWNIPEKPVAGIRVECLQPEEGAAKWLNTYRVMMLQLHGSDL